MQLPSWIPGVIALLALALWIGWFSPAIYDSDFWWHLKTGQYIVEHHSFPIPDPFSYTTAMAPPAYSGEAMTRRFNLTHEWLSQVLLYLVYRAAGFPGIVLARTAILLGMCLLVAFVAWRRSKSFYWALGAGFVTASMARWYAFDRPYLVTFLLVAAAIAIVEDNRWLWALPPVFLIWANLHGGYFLGWAVLAAYCGECWWLSRRGSAPEGARRLYLVSAACFVASAINPNGLRIFQVLLAYRSSYMQSRLLEWAPPAIWTISEFSLLLFGTAAILFRARARVRVADWILFLIFAAAAVSAQRNVVFLGIVAPFLSATYFPWKRAVPAWAPPAASAALVAVCVFFSYGRMFQFKVADWKFPSGAADFILSNKLPGPIFNTYEFGGYLIWRMWPQQQVFIDGRALSESVFNDYGRILYNHDASGGPSAQQLLDRYNVQTIVMNTMEYTQGLVYLLAPGLSDPKQNDWHLLYADDTAMVLTRQMPANATAISPLHILEHMENECSWHIRHEPQATMCARSMGQVFTQVGDTKLAKKWLEVYLDLPHPPDPVAEDAYQQLLNTKKQ